MADILIDCPHYADLGCEDYRERSADRLWLASLQPQLQTPESVKREELQRDIVEQLEEEYKETPRAQQRKAKVKPSNVNKKLDLESDDDEEILEILRKHNKNVENKRAPVRRGGKENCQAAANPPLSSRKVMPGNNQICTRKSVAPVNRRVSVIRRVISPKPQTISPCQSTTPELNDCTKKVTKPFRRASVVVAQPQPDFMKRLAAAKDPKLDMKLEGLDQAINSPKNEANLNMLVRPNQISDKISPGVERDACKRVMPRRMSCAAPQPDVLKQPVKQLVLDLKELDPPVEDSKPSEGGDEVPPSNGAQANSQSVSKKRVTTVPAQQPPKVSKPASKDVSKSKVVTQGAATKTKAPVLRGKAPIIKGKEPVIKSASQANKTKANNLKALVTKNTSKTLTSNRKVTSAPPTKPVSKPPTAGPQKVSIKSATNLAKPTKPLSNSAKSVVPLAKSKKPASNPAKSAVNPVNPTSDQSKPSSSKPVTKPNPPVKRPRPSTVRSTTRPSSAPTVTTRRPSTVPAKPPPFAAPKPLTKPPPFKPTKRKAKPEYSPTKILPGISKFLDDPNFVMKPMRPVVNFTPRAVPLTTAQRTDPEPSRLSDQSDSTEPEPRKHSRYSIETPSPSHHDNTLDSDSDSDMDEHLKEKIRAHNKWVQDQAKAKKSGEGKSAAGPKFRRVTLHIGSPSRPKFNVKRRS